MGSVRTSGEALPVADTAVASAHSLPSLFIQSAQPYCDRKPPEDSIPTFVHEPPPKLIIPPQSETTREGRTCRTCSRPLAYINGGAPTAVWGCILVAGMTLTVVSPMCRCVLRRRMLFHSETLLKACLQWQCACMHADREDGWNSWVTALCAAEQDAVVILARRRRARLEDLVECEPHYGHAHQRCVRPWSSSPSSWACPCSTPPLPSQPSSSLPPSASTSAVRMHPFLF